VRATEEGCVMSPQIPELAQVANDVEDRAADRPRALPTADRAPQVAGDDFELQLARLGRAMGEFIGRSVVGR
jgi:hypothetical protein